MAVDLSSPYISPETKPPIDDNWAARRKVGDEARRLIASLVSCTTDTEQLHQVAEALALQSDILQSDPQLHGRVAFEEASGYGDRAHLGYELGSMDGQCNPIAAPISAWVEGDRVYGRVTMGWQYEGPPFSVHGGFVAALFDHFLGVGQRITKQPGFTGTLTVKYLKPTPINTELRLEGWVQRTEGRKNFLAGEMWAGEIKTATCEGIFISISPEQYRTIRERK